MEQNTKVDVRREGDVGIIDVKGEMTTFSEKMLQDVYEQLSDDNVEKICFNFSDVSYINSAGMAIIIGILTKTRQRQQTLYGYGLSEHFQKIFGMVGITKYMTHHDNEAEALACFAKSQKPE